MRRKTFFPSGRITLQYKRSRFVHIPHPTIKPISSSQSLRYNHKIFNSKYLFNLTYQLNMQFTYVASIFSLILAVQSAAISEPGSTGVLEKKANCGCNGDEAVNAWPCGSTYPDGRSRCPNDRPVSAKTSGNEMRVWLIHICAHRDVCSGVITASKS